MIKKAVLAKGLPFLFGKFQFAKFVEWSSVGERWVFF